MSEAPYRPDVNRASREDLLAAGLAPHLAERIVAHRTEHGPIHDENELYMVVRDNEIRLDQLLGIVEIGGDQRGQGYST